MLIKCYKPVPENGKFQSFDTITAAKSVIWTHRFYGVGSFQLSLPETTLQPRDIIQHGNRSGFVMKVERTFSGATVYGYDMKGLVTLRHILPPTTYIGDAETVIKSIATEALATGKRAISGLTVLPNALSLTDAVTLEVEDENVADVLENFCRANEIGYDCIFSESGITFDAVKGRDMTELTVFSRRRHNIDDISYVTDHYNACTVGLTQTENEDETITYSEVGDAEGIYRQEVVVDGDASEFMAKNAAKESLRGTANDRLTYGEDWKLGDTVTCIYNDISTTLQITEVEEVFEHGTMRVIPVFGEEKENPIKKLLRKKG